MPQRVLVAWALVVTHFSATIVSTDASRRPFIISTSSISRQNNDNGRSYCLACINKLRGGDPSYESNPNYQNSPTLADLDKDGFYHTTSLQNNNQRQRPPPLTQLIRNYFAELYKYSPTLFNGTIASLILFLVWQFPSSSYVSKILRNHFVTSQYNVIQKKRYHALILSAFSHASFHHIAVNMYAYLTFGRSVKPVLARHGIALWAFVLSAAIVGNLAFLVFDKGHGSCVGLSGVTLALLAFDALTYPTKELRMIVSFIPITLPAYYLFVGLLGFSVLGILGISVGKTNVAHSTHLGGLVYGALVYEAFKRGWLRIWTYRARKAYNASRGS